MSSSSQKDRLDYAGLVMVCAGVLWAPLPMGSVHWPMALGLCLWMLTAAALVSFARVRKSKRVRVSPLSVVWAIATLWSALQLLPWPGVLVRWLAPGRWRAYQAALTHGVATESMMLVPSLDPGATADMALRFMALCAACWAVENMSLRIRQGRVIPITVGACALLSLGVGMLQAYVSPDLFFGFYEAERVPLFGSTFVNANQSSALCALGAWMWLVLACARGIKLQRYRAGYALGALACLCGVGLQQSLGVWLVLAASAAMAGVYYGVARRGGMKSATLRASVIGVIVLTWVAAWGGAISRVNEARGSFETRAEMVRAALRASLEYPVLGSGAWSVERALGPHVNWAVVGLTRIETIEAEVVEWSLTLGWPVTLLMWAGLLVSWAGPLGRAQTRARRGAAACGIGLFACMIAQLHFPFFMLGLGIPMVVAWSALREQALVLRTRREFDEPLSSRETPAPPTRALRSWWVMGTKISNPQALALCTALLLACGVSIYRLTVAPGRIFNEDVDAMSTQRLHTLGELLPSEPQLYVRLAASPELKDDLAAQQALYHVAYEFEPTLPYEILWARALWRAGDRERARPMFSRALRVQGYTEYKRGLAVMLETVSEEEERAKIVEPGGRELWERTWQLIDRVEGEVLAQDFLQALVDLNEGDVTRHELLIDFYIVKKRWELLDMYAQLMMMWKFDDVKRGEELKWRTRIRILEARGDGEALERLVTDRIEQFAHNEVLAPHVLSLTPRLLQGTQASRMKPHLARAYELVCRGESAVTMRDRCEIHRASIFEYEQNYERAEEIWKSRARRTGSWDVLGEYYERRGLCTSLRVLVKQVSQGMIHQGKKRNEAADRKLTARLEARYDRCAMVDEE